ncbi:arsenate reductase (glutaredoxin) [Flavobacterium psychrotolerans]|uniref:Arsenate reductase (Glutaredoxin) n=1 Tax=Flavobacterium psychrotolerans TaxID=2169410 RepID=A0A2U1JHN1_9FLAO|nr:arsenate reductase (glutaredoxin) [Flavobacterium psychrotolerans]PWA04646.1 arsenate reductase (glutaredoxin) [Flavobacterium psychrotolerans]
MIQIFHNSRCGKSRDCIAFLEQSGKEFEIIKYLENSPTFNELTEIIRKLNIPPLALVRQKEKIWMEKFKNTIMTDEEIIQAMIENPILIERPIVISGENAVIARPFEKAIPLI